MHQAPTLVRKDEVGCVLDAAYATAARRQQTAEIVMQTTWLSPTNFVTGDPTLRISYPFVSHPSTVVTCTAPGDLKWLSMGLRLPPEAQIEAVIICYEVSNARSFISQLRLAEMTTPDRATVVHDDPTHLTSTAPATYSSAVSGLVPSGAVTLELRLNFQDTSDEIELGAVGVMIQATTRPCAQVADFPTGGSDDTVQLTNAFAWLAASPNRTLSFAHGKTYIISALITLNGLATFRVEGNGATIKAANGMPVVSGKQLLEWINCTDGDVLDLNLDGNRANRTPVTTPNQPVAHNVEISTGCARIRFCRCSSNNAVVDGFILDTDTPWDLASLPIDIQLFNCSANNSYRNNLSVINTNRFRDYCGIYTAAGGTAPQAGIDFEPNAAGNFGNLDARIYGTRVDNNAGPGFQVTGSNTTVRMYGVKASNNGEAAVEGAWGYLEVNGIELDLVGAGITGGVINAGIKSGETHLDGVVATNITTGSDLNPLIYIDSTNTGPFSIGTVRAKGCNAPLLNAGATVTVGELNAVGVNQNFVALIKGNAAANSIIGKLIGIGIKGGLYSSAPNLEVIDVTMINPTTAGQVLWFDAGATNAVLRGALIHQDSAIPAGQNGVYFNSAPRYVDRIICRCLGGTDYTAANAVVFAGGVAGAEIGRITPYPLVYRVAISPGAIANGAAYLSDPFTLTGAALGDAVSATYSQPLQGLMLEAWVDSANSVKAAFVNRTGGSVTPDAGTLKFRLEKRVGLIWRGAFLRPTHIQRADQRRSERKARRCGRPPSLEYEQRRR
jgi:hypothetical protein